MALQALWDVTQQFNNKNGTILTSGKIYIYFKNRTALATTYHDEAGTVVNRNPILLDNNGRATAFADPVYSYTIVVCDYYGKELFSQDIILHDAISTAENVLITGSDGSVTIDTTELSNGVKYDLSVNTDIIATKQSVDDLTLVVNNNTIDIDNIKDELTTKKDKQTTLTFDGSATKTIKKITQNSNGEMNVEFEDIDLPPEVPNVEIISPNGTIDVQSSTDVGTNTKTFAIDIAGENGAKNYAFLKSQAMPVNATEMALEITDRETNGITWNTIDQRLEFDEAIKLIDLNFNLAYEIDTANGVSYEDLILYIYSDGQLLEQQTYSIDTSKAKFVCIWNKKILDPSNLQFSIKVPKAGSVDASIDINDETFKSIGSSVSGSTYSAGPNINITDDVISGRDWTPELNDKLDTSAFDLPNSANWDNTYNTVLANSAQWNEGGSSDIELYSSDGSLLISADGSAYDLKLNEQLSAKNYFVTDNTNNNSPLSPTSGGTVWFGTSEPKTDLSSNTYKDEFWQWITSEIVIPKEMKLFNVKFNFRPYWDNHEQRPTHSLNSFRLYLDDIQVYYLTIEWDNMYTSLRSYQIEKNILIHNPRSADSILTLKSADITKDWNGWVNININDETYKSIGTSGSGIPDNYDSLYSTVSSNSASWNAGGGEGATYSAGSNINITNNTISGKDWSNEINVKLDTTAFTPLALPNSANWDNTYNTVNSNSAQWSNDTTYTAGSNIDITNDVISGRDWSDEINSKLDTSAFDLPNSANWDNTYDTVSSNSATWNNNSQIINHNQVASGTLVVDNNEYINVSGLDVSGVLTVKSMNTSVITDEPITQCGGTLSFNTQPSSINFVDSNDTPLPKLDGIPTTFSGNAYQFTIINGIVACQEIK